MPVTRKKIFEAGNTSGSTARNTTTEEVNAEFKAAGRTALLGMGADPGTTNAVS